MTASFVALQRLRDLGPVLHARPTLPSVSACGREAERIVQIGQALQTPDPQMLETLRRGLQQACADGKISDLSPHMLRQAPLVFWDRDPQAAGFPGLFDAVFAGAAQRPHWLRYIIEAWLRDFGPDRTRLPEAGRAVAAVLPALADPRLLPWREASARFALFDAALGPSRVGGAFLHGPDEVSEILAQTGMDDPNRAAGHYFTTCVREMLKALPDAMRRPDATALWARAVRVLETTHESQDRKGRRTQQAALRVTELRVETAIGALTAWRSGTPPAPKLREIVQAFLVRILGDPRVSTSRWSDVPEDLVRMVRGWLAGESLEAFFELISQMNSDKQWQYRLHFWRAVYRVSQATQPAEIWVVLGAKLSYRAKLMEGLSKSFGEMDSDQAVLLVKIGNLVMSEWSNVGPLRAWTDDDRRAPRLYERKYEAHALKLDCLAFPAYSNAKAGSGSITRGLWHRGPAEGHWQGRAAALLKQRVGLNLTPQDYRQ